MNHVWSRRFRIPPPLVHTVSMAVALTMATSGSALVAPQPGTKIVALRDASVLEGELVDKV